MPPLSTHRYFENPTKVVKFILEFLGVDSLSVEQLQHIGSLAAANSMSNPASLKGKGTSDTVKAAAAAALSHMHMLNETHAVMAEFFRPFQERLHTALGHAHALRMEASQHYTVDIGY